MKEEKGLQLNLKARSREQENSEYLPLEHQGLSATIEVQGGSGHPRNPFHVRIQVRNKNQSSWFGVIHIELPFPKENPRFFMPAFLYGRNRGESPQNVLN
ncbi:hypothetical protein, partial [[Roseibacterium] beibuensis]|uniref:hypothetical protein n=1 Tax=[Roseibacterium] beibuensis TaxID=1193142 RepID=UPI0031E6139E